MISMNSTSICLNYFDMTCVMSSTFSKSTLLSLSSYMASTSPRSAFYCTMLASVVRPSMDAPFCYCALLAAAYFRKALLIPSSTFISIWSFMIF